MPIPILPSTKDYVAHLTSDFETSSVESHSSVRRLSTKSLNIHTLFHTRNPSLIDARNRALSQLFDSDITDHKPLQEAPATSTYHIFPRNLSNSSFTDYENETRTCLSSIRLTGKYALHDSCIGARLSSAHVGRDFIERVLDLILLECVEFEQVLDSVAKAAKACEQKVELINYGPGTGLARVAMRALKERIPTTQITFDDVSSAKPAVDRLPAKPSHEPIAIVGMAVNLPGARSTEELWRVLEQGINTVEEVSSSQ